MWESNVLGFLFLRASETVISILKYELSQAVVCARKLLNRQIPCGWHGAKKAGWKASELKQDAAHEQECSHVEHFCETGYLNSLHFSPVTASVHCRLWKAEEGGVQSVECRV